MAKRRPRRPGKSKPAKTELPVVVFTDYEQFRDGPPGAVIFFTGQSVPEGTVTGIGNKCPGCGAISSLTIEHVGCQSIGARWDLVQRDPLTLFPSVWHAKDLGGCGWHGHAKNGVWVGRIDLRTPKHRKNNKRGT